MQLFDLLVMLFHRPVMAQRLVMCLDQRFAQLPLAPGDLGQRFLQFLHPLGLDAQLGHLPQARLQLPKALALHRDRLDDELVGTRIRIPFEFLSYLSRNRLSIEGHLGSIDREFMAVHVDDAQLRFVEQVQQGIPREETQMGRVQQADVAVVEVAGEKRKRARCRARRSEPR